MLAKPSGIPRLSGCYLFRNERGVVIYVGKARSLAQRLSSYFQRTEALTHKTQALMAELTGNRGLFASAITVSGISYEATDLVSETLLSL